MEQPSPMIATFHGIDLKIRLDTLSDEAQTAFKASCLDFGKNLLTALNELLRENQLDIELGAYELSGTYPQGAIDGRTGPQSE